MIPLYGFLEGDTMGLVIMTSAGETVGALIEKLRASANVRVASPEGMRLRHRGVFVDPSLTVGEAGIEPLDRFDVVVPT
jgi:hypothetical protein